jgi:hypothetical protein
MRTAALAVLALCIGARAAAQSPAAVQDAAVPSRVVAVNPLGFLQFGPTIEAELPVGSAAAFAGVLRLPQFGLLSHVLDSELESGWMLGGAVRLYRDGARRPAGWHFGPRVEAGYTRTGGERVAVYGGGIEAAHRWVNRSGFALAAGGMVGGFRSKYLKGLALMGSVTVGKTF